jgi:hypothetical protein
MDTIERPKPLHTYKINGLTVQTGDIICTTAGNVDLQIGDFWRFLGKLVPGDVDHIAIYLGPEGRMVEAGGNGIIEFSVTNHTWDAAKMQRSRAGMLDQFYGVAYPLRGRKVNVEEELNIRLLVAEYCMEQAAAKKPYNINFLNPNTEDAFYCSQLAYKAYLPHGIDLNTGQGVPNLKGTSQIVFPQEIWSGCPHQRAAFGVSESS